MRLPNVKGGNSLSLLTSIKDMHDAHQDYKSTREQEITKRMDSSNRKEIHIEGIRAQRDIILKALDNDLEINQFKAQIALSVIDRALESGNLDQLDLGLSAMVKVAETSSLSSLKDIIRETSDENNVLDV